MKLKKLVAILGMVLPSQMVMAVEMLTPGLTLVLGLVLIQIANPVALLLGVFMLGLDLSLVLIALPGGPGFNELFFEDLVALL